MTGALQCVFQDRSITPDVQAFRVVSSKHCAVTLISNEHYVVTPTANTLCGYSYLQCPQISYSKVNLLFWWRYQKLHCSIELNSGVYFQLLWNFCESPVHPKENMSGTGLGDMSGYANLSFSLNVENNILAPNWSLGWEQCLKGQVKAKYIETLVYTHTLSACGCFIGVQVCVCVCVFMFQCILP